MKKIYVSKVIIITGGLIDQAELESVYKSFDEGLSPEQAAQVVINNR